MISNIQSYSLCNTKSSINIYYNSNYVLFYNKDISIIYRNYPFDFTVAYFAI